MRHLRSGSLLLAFVFVGAVSACGGANATAGTGTPISGTPAATKPAPTLTVGSGSTPTSSDLCSLVSAAQFSQITGLPIDGVQAVTGTIPAQGFTHAVGCQGMSSGTPIAFYRFYYFDSASDADAYYTSQHQVFDAEGPTMVVSGWGDMAFYEQTVLFIAKGSVIITIFSGANGSLDDDQHIAQLILGAV